MSSIPAESLAVKPSYCDALNGVCNHEDHWLAFALNTYEAWLETTLGFYDRLDLQQQEIDHLAVKAQSFIGPKPDAPDLQATWEYLRQQVNDCLRDWIPTKRQLEYYKYLRSAHWQYTRQNALRSANYKCHMCGGEAQHVHHLSYDNLGAERPDDLRVVCAECHRELHPEKVFHAR